MEPLNLDFQGPWYNEIFFYYVTVYGGESIPVWSKLNEKDFKKEIVDKDFVKLGYGSGEYYKEKEIKTSSIIEFKNVTKSYREMYEKNMKIYRNNFEIVKELRRIEKGKRYKLAKLAIKSRSNDMKRLMKKQSGVHFLIDWSTVDPLMHLDYYRLVELLPRKIRKEF